MDQILGSVVDLHVDLVRALAGSSDPCHDEPGFAGGGCSSGSAPQISFQLPIAVAEPDGNARTRRPVAETHKAHGVIDSGRPSDSEGKEVCVIPSEVKING